MGCLEGETVMEEGDESARNAYDDDDEDVRHGRHQTHLGCQSGAGFETCLASLSSARTGA